MSPWTSLIPSLAIRVAPPPGAQAVNQSINQSINQSKPVNMFLVRVFRLLFLDLEIIFKLVFRPVFRVILNCKSCQLEIMLKHCIRTEWTIEEPMGMFVTKQDFNFSLGLLCRESVPANTRTGTAVRTYPFQRYFDTVQYLCYLQPVIFTGILQILEAAAHSDTVVSPGVWRTWWMQWKAMNIQWELYFAQTLSNARLI